MDMRMAYPYEKFSVAVDAMATGLGSLSERIHSAYMSFHPLQPRDFDAFPEIKADYVRLMGLLTAHNDDTRTEGHVPKTLRLSSDEELKKIANLIVSIAGQITWKYVESY